MLTANQISLARRVGCRVFLALAALGWVQPKPAASPDTGGPQATAAAQVSVLRVLAAIFLILGCLLLLRDIVALQKFGRITQPLLATLAVGMTSLGAWLWLKAWRQAAAA